MLLRFLAFLIDRNSGNALLGPLLQQECTRTNMFPCSLAEWGALVAYGVRVRAGLGVPPKGWLRWLAHPFGGVESRGHVEVHCFCSQHPVFCSRLFRSGSWSFCSFCILFSIICPNCPRTWLFLVPYSLFVFCCWRRCLSKCKHCSKESQDPRWKRLRPPEQSESWQ